MQHVYEVIENQYITIDAQDFMVDKDFILNIFWGKLKENIALKKVWNILSDKHKKRMVKVLVLELVFLTAFFKYLDLIYLFMVLFL